MKYEGKILHRVLQILGLFTVPLFRAFLAPFFCSLHRLKCTPIQMNETCLISLEVPSSCWDLLAGPGKLHYATTGRKGDEKGQKKGAPGGGFNSCPFFCPFSVVLDRYCTWEVGFSLLYPFYTSKLKREKSKRTQKGRKEGAKKGNCERPYCLGRASIVISM